MATYNVHIMSNRMRRLYSGVANDLHRRVYEHQHRLVPGFTSKYFLERLVYFEDIGAATAARRSSKVGSAPGKSH